MQKSNTNKKNEMKPVFKPYLRGKALCRTDAKRSLRVFGFTLIFVFLFVLVGTALSFDNDFWRIVLNAGLLLACAGILMNEGARQGETDTAFAEIALRRKNDGKNVPESEKELCFHPLKGFVTMFIGALPLVVVAVVFAVVAQKQAYSLGTLPSWVAAYNSVPEIGEALAYYSETAVMQLEDILRIAVRLILFPYVNMTGADNYHALYLVDKLSPILCLILPSFYGVGYLRGPYLRALVHGNIRMNRRRHNKNERKAREQRVRKPEKKELI